MNLPSLLMVAGASCALLCPAAVGAASPPDTNFCVFSFETSTNEIEYYVPTACVFAPTNAWSPGIQPFPANIRSLAEAARAHLRQTKKTPRQLRLTQFAMETMYRAQPSPDPTQVPEPSTWYLRFGFGFDDETGRLIEPPDFQVVMLLEGTIAEQKLNLTRNVIPKHGSRKPAR
jgi:hypothetical protein